MELYNPWYSLCVHACVSLYAGQPVRQGEVICLLSLCPHGTLVSVLHCKGQANRERRNSGGGGDTFDTQRLWQRTGLQRVYLNTCLSTPACLPICLCAGVVRRPDGESAVWWWMKSGFRHADGQTGLEDWMARWLKWLAVKWRRAYSN